MRTFTIKLDEHQLAHITAALINNVSEVGDESDAKGRHAPRRNSHQQRLEPVDDDEIVDLTQD